MNKIQKYITYLSLLFLIFVLIMIGKKLYNAKSPIDAIEKLEDDLKQKKETYDDLANTLTMLDIKPYKARYFYLFRSNTTISEAVYDKKSSRYVSNNNSKLFSNDMAVISIYRLCKSLLLNGFTLYENNCIQFETKTKSYSFKNYKILYVEEWDKLPDLLDDYCICVTRNDVLKTNDKWIYVIDEHWGVVSASPR